MKALIDEYSDEEFNQIVSQSNSMSEISQKLGYSATSGNSLTRIRKRIDELQISAEHFSSMNKRPILRTEENIFIENSTASQRTLRDWYFKGKYTPYICSICGQEPVWQGKELTLILDHINGINKDDRLENLRWVCPNCNQQLDTTGSKNPNRKIIAKKYYCQDCGIEINKGAIRCIACYNKYRTVPLENMPVTREELKELIRTKPFTQIGKQFQVSDNAIRKWCDKFSLPRKSSEIKKYSDDDWSKI